MCAKTDLDKMQGHAAEKPVQNMVMVVSVTAAVLRVLVGKISSVGGLTSTDQSVWSVDELEGRPVRGQPPLLWHLSINRCM